eukprot:CAMPEP_0170144650 /NCGR_PEP_ID=MMETSP0033_2-20121228/15108_1 /TAXON_ID=195969 /ORGANISM="Dolichomastix tenuilepis, Strain CCMP3274" /LENGTH=230 /DNA_ID=CAMNT_0010381169 /DNA_START=11 /DNA_END=705 /DNA_ORIENTATION=+
MSATKDLVDMIDIAATECLNEGNGREWANAIKQGYREDAGLYLGSDPECDEQLLIKVAFNQLVKLSGIVVRAKGVSETQGPKKIKLYINQPAMDFSNTKKLPVAQELNLESSQLEEGAVIPLNFTKFQKVGGLCIFVQSNQSDEEVTRIDKIAFIGEGAQVSSGELKKAEARKPSAFFAAEDVLRPLLTPPRDSRDDAAGEKELVFLPARRESAVPRTTSSIPLDWTADV